MFFYNENNFWLVIECDILFNDDDSKFNNIIIILILDNFVSGFLDIIGDFVIKCNENDWIVVSYSRW